MKKTKKTTDSIEAVAGFEWPAFNSEAERMRDFSGRYAEVDYPKALSDVYGIKIKKTKNMLSDTMTLNVGDTISLAITHVDKKNVTFDMSSVAGIKESIACTVNLMQYPVFRDIKRPVKVDCRVVAKDMYTITVDPIIPLIEGWLRRKGCYDNRYSYQYNMNHADTVQVSNLRLVRGGYLGSIRMDTVSDFLGCDVYHEAFIPGSQIVLNIEKDFNRWEGQTIEAFITDYNIRAPQRGNIILCSRKELLKFEGRKKLIDYFKTYTEQGKTWDALHNTEFDARITGVCNTNNKKGVFIEIDSCINGMINVPEEELLHYHAGDTLAVRIKDFDERTVYNPLSGQYEHVMPYVIEDGLLKEFNIRCVFEKYAA